MKVIIALLFLILPTAYEVFVDRKGDHHPNTDWKLRGLMCILCGAVVGLIYENILWGTIQYTISSVLLFAGLFPYWINFVHLKNGVTSRIPYKLLTLDEILYHVKHHLSATAWPDKEWWWRRLNPNVRFVVYLIFVVSGLIVFAL